MQSSFVSPNTSCSPDLSPWLLIAVWFGRARMPPVQFVSLNVSCNSVLSPRMSAVTRFCLPGSQLQLSFVSPDANATQFLPSVANCSSIFLPWMSVAVQFCLHDASCSPRFSRYQLESSFSSLWMRVAVQICLPVCLLFSRGVKYFSKTSQPI